MKRIILWHVPVLRKMRALYLDTPGKKAQDEVKLDTPSPEGAQRRGGGCAVLGLRDGVSEETAGASPTHRTGTSREQSLSSRVPGTCTPFDVRC